MVGRNVEDLVYVMRGEEGKDENYVRLVVLHAQRLVNAERNNIKPNQQHNKGYFTAITDYANGLYTIGGVIQAQDDMVRKDVKRMCVAINADRDIRDAQLEL